MYMGKAIVTHYTSWVVAYCDEGILDYYRWWYKKKKGYKLGKTETWISYFYCKR